MAKILKINLGKHLLYLLVYIISMLIYIFVDNFVIMFSVDLYFLELYINNLSQIFGGLSIYLYQYKYFKTNSNAKYFGLELIYNKQDIKSKDNIFIILLLIFLASIFEFVLVIIEYYCSKVINSKISRLFKLRIGGLSTIVSSLLCSYSLNFKLGKHHKVSLIFMSIIIIISIILEIVFKSSNFLIKPYLFGLFLNIFRVVIISFIDCIEKYLYEIDYLNPFKLLMFMGILELIYAIIFTVCKNLINIEEIEKIFTNNNSGEICKLIFLLLGVLISSTITNVYKIYCNVIYSPMIKSLADYIFIPFLNIFTFLNKMDFYDSIAYFVICEIISLIIDFLSCVYNEFIILFCCGLEHDTKFGISIRAELLENRPNSLIIEDNQTNDNNQENKSDEASLNQN